MFEPEKFLQKPPEDILEDLKNLSLTRDELVMLAGHLKIPTKSSATKPDLRNEIIPVLVDQKIVEEEDGHRLIKTQEEVMKTNIQSAHKAINEGIYVRGDREYELEKLKLELASKERIALAEQERQEREAEREHKERLLKLERESQEKERQFELEKLKLQQSVQQPGQNFDVIKNFQAVPSFQEDDVDMYFLHFEKLATNLKWPKQYWTILLQKAFIGKAREIFSQLSVEQSGKYDYVKEVIMRGYQLNPEAYRQKFRNCQKDNNQTYVEFARVKKQLFDRWCHSKNVNKDFEKLRQLILIEEFKRKIPFHMKTFIDEKQTDNLQDAADLTDGYSLTHGGYSQRHQELQPAADVSPGLAVEPQTMNSTAQSDNGTTFCNYCRRYGHLISECYKLANKRTLEQSDPQPSGHIAPVQFVSDNPMSTMTACAKQSSIMAKFEPFMQSAYVSTSADLSQAKPIRILRDTGSAQSILLEGKLPLSNGTYTGNKVRVKGIGTSSENHPSVPLHKVFLSSGLVNGPVTVGVQPSLPVDGIDLILGNDLAGDKVMVNPLVNVDTTSCSIQRNDLVQNAKAKTRKKKRKN